jgi:hypothetical protein
MDKSFELVNKYDSFNFFNYDQLMKLCENMDRSQICNEIVFRKMRSSNNTLVGKYLCLHFKIKFSEIGSDPCNWPNIYAYCSLIRVLYCSNK